MKVLVVDDETTILDCLQEFLVLFGHSVITAENGKDGLNKFLLEPNSFDAIISDINMPCINGFEMVAEIRNQQFDIPVIFVSAQRNIKSHQEIASLMPCQWLEKPFHFQQIDAVLQQIVREQADRVNHRLTDQIVPTTPSFPLKSALYAHSIL